MDLVAKIKIGFLAIFIIGVVSLTIFTPTKGKFFMNICFNTPWKNLHPGKQNTLIGGLIISQQFESLVKIDTEGNVIPGIARSWVVSDDFKSIRFKLDESKSFSNGSVVTANDVLQSWVTSFNMSKTGPNNSLKDVLYNVEGFEAGLRPEEIKGFKVISDHEFEITFKNPFRMAIYHLRGARFSIYKNIENKIIGSGQYSFDVDNSKDTLELVQNKTQDKVFVRYLNSKEIINEVKTGMCDVFYAPSGGPSLSEHDKTSIDYVESEDAVHISFFLNTKKGIFSDLNMRRAFLYLVHKNKETSQLFLKTPDFSKADPQLYNSFSQGRLEDEETAKIIKEGEEFVSEFINRLSKEKISIFVNDKGFLKEAFSAIGLEPFLVEEVGSSSELTTAVYKGEMQQDMTAAFISVLSYDPDGIYHALGRHGAILNPYIANENIFNLLEEGRAITDREKLDGFYKNVSRAFLREVPFIHLGFSRNVLFYNKQKISVSKDAFRNTLDFSSFIER